MTGTVALWRIATEAPDYTAGDLSGKGAEMTGGRWNRKGTAVLYASTSRALACLETVVHLAKTPLPLNRYLVEINVPLTAWKAARAMDRAAPAGWDAEPAGKASLDWGMQWLASGSPLLAKVPSIIVPEEFNVLLNPAHPDIGAVTATVVRKWLHDARLRH